MKFEYRVPKPEFLPFSISIESVDEAAIILRALDKMSHSDCLEVLQDFYPELAKESLRAISTKNFHSITNKLRDGIRKAFK